MALFGILLSTLIAARHGLMQTSHLLLQAGIVSARHDGLLTLAVRTMALPAEAVCAPHASRLQAPSRMTAANVVHTERMCKPRALRHSAAPMPTVLSRGARDRAHMLTCTAVVMLTRHAGAVS